MDIKKRFAASAIHTANLLESNLKTLAGDALLLVQYSSGVPGNDLLKKLTELNESYITFRSAIEKEMDPSPSLLEELGLSNIDPFPSPVLELIYESDEDGKFVNNDELGFFKRF